MDESFLTLGWAVDKLNEPRWWKKASNAGRPIPDTMLVRIPAAAMGGHTVVVAQSNSGKSYFLGRLLEEILLQTRGRCLVLDINGDYCRMGEIREPELWSQARYDPEFGKTELPHEPKREVFEKLWQARVPKIRVLTRRFAHASEKINEPWAALQFWWPDLSVAVLAEDFGAVDRTSLYHCHSYYRALSKLAIVARVAAKEVVPITDVAETILKHIGDERREGMDVDSEDLRAQLDTHFKLDRLPTAFNAASLDALEEYGILTAGDPGVRRVRFSGRALTRMLTAPMEGEKSVTIHGRDERAYDLRRTVEKCKDQVCDSVGLISPRIRKYYFGKLRQYCSEGILLDEPRRRPRGGSQCRLDVVDIPSMGDADTRVLAINALLEAEWASARSAWFRALADTAEKDMRVPTFIVIDEAHNVVPAEPTGDREEALRNQFRTIAAEGRKFGLYLILVSQRPDKLDPLSVSECQNKAIMRVDSAAVLDLVKRQLGLQNVPRIERALAFKKGRALLTGEWAGGAQMATALYCAARRTCQGGRNLRTAHWAVPPDDAAQQSTVTPR